MPNGRSAPGNVSIGPPAGVPDVPTNVSMSAVGTMEPAARAATGRSSAMQPARIEATIRTPLFTLPRSARPLHMYNPLGRHRILKTLALNRYVLRIGACAALLAFPAGCGGSAVPGGSQPAPPPSGDPRSPIAHVVVIVQENRT